MEANELRIGNYATDSIQTGAITVFNNDACVLKHKSGIVKCRISDLSPVPLTEEWLFKFGFVEKIDAYFYNDYCIEDIHNGVTWVISEFDHITDEFTAIGCGIKYVHQLQNLYFALTGEELTFKSE